MKLRSTLVAALIALTASTAGASGAHETVNVMEARGQWKGFEFKKTGEFIKEMESRPDFPVSTPLAYDYVQSLKALGEPIAPGRKKSIVAYLAKAQQKDGGYIGDKLNNASSSLFTEMTIDTLAQLQPPGAAETERARKFILSLQNADGGFGFSSATRASTLLTTYYAVKTLGSMKALGALDKAKTAAYVKSFEKRGSGGFGYSSGNGSATAKATFAALYTLDALGALDDATRKGALRFLEGTPCGKNGGAAQPELNEVAYAVQAAHLLKAKEAIDGKKLEKFLQAIYIPVNGGFAPLEGYGATPDSTATALVIFSRTGRLKTAAGSRQAK